MTARKTALKTTTLWFSVAALASLAGCGAGGDVNEQSGTGVSPAATPAPAPAPAPTPVQAQAPAPAPGAPVTYYFSDCQPGASADCVVGNNAYPGTQAQPKQNLSGINVNGLPAGSRLLFKRGGVFLWSQQMMLDNPNTTAALPLTFDAWGTGAVPVLDVVSNGILFGMYNNTNNDGGYVFRNLKFQGRDVNASYGMFMMHNLRDVIIENVEITGFYFGIQSQAAAPYGVTNVTLRNNVIRRNRGMGILGQFSDTLIEGNTIEENNFSGSGFEHGTYLSGNPVAAGERLYSGVNVTLRNNRYIRNSVNGTRCTGGNMTFHGRMDNVLIEGNTIEQSPGWTTPTDFAAGGCWLMSITQGWEANRGAEGMTRFVVRNNKLINGGNTSIATNSAPGVLIEGNTIINRQPVQQLAFGLGHGFDFRPTDIVSGLYPNGDIADGNAIVRNNTICQSNGATGAVVRDNSPNSTVSNNVVLTGTAATTGVCAP